MVAKKRKIIHIADQKDLSPFLSTSIKGWVKDTEKQLFDEAKNTSDTKSLSVIGYKASKIHSSIEKSYRKLRGYSQRFQRTIQLIQAYSHELNYLFVHPLTGELNYSRPQSITSALSQWFIWKFFLFLNYGDMLHPLLYGSWEILNKKALEENLKLHNADYIKKSIHKLRGTSKNKSLKILKKIVSDLNVSEIPFLHSPVYSYLPFPGDYNLISKDKTQFLLHYELLAFYLPSIAKKIPKEISLNISKYFSKLSKKHPLSASWNIIFTYIYDKDLTFISFEGFGTIQGAYNIASELHLHTLNSLLDEQMAIRLDEKDDYIKPLDNEGIPPKTTVSFGYRKNVDTSLLHTSHCKKETSKKPFSEILNRPELFSLEVHLKNGKKRNIFPVQCFTKNESLSKEIEQNNSLDLSGFSEETLDKLLCYLTQPEEEHPKYLQDHDLFSLVSYLDIVKLSDPFVNCHIESIIQSRHKCSVYACITYLDLSNFYIHLSAHHFQSIIEQVNLSVLRVLNLSHCRLLHGYELEELAKNAPFLKTLNLSECRNMHPTALAYFAQNCNYLENIILSNISTIDDRDISLLLKNSPDLKTLNLNGCLKLTGKCLLELKSFCLPLSKLHVSRIPGLTSNTLQRSIPSFETLEVLEAKNLKSLSRSFLYSLQNRSRLIKQLSLSSGSTRVRLPKLFFRSFYLLEILEILNMKKMSNQHTKDLFYYSQYLKKVNLSYCTKISDEAFHSIEKKPKHLLELSLSGLQRITGKGLKELIFQSKLEVLNLKRCTNLRKEHLIDLIQSCPYLKFLNLSFCPVVDEQVLEVIASSCAKLEELKIACCMHLSGASLPKIFQSCKKLKSLDLGNNQLLNLDTLNKITESGLDLRAIGLSYLKQLPKESIKKFIEANPNLEVISLNHCSQIDDSILDIITKNCKSLKDIRLFFCKELSLKGISNLLYTPASPLLENIELRGTRTKEREIISLLLEKHFLKYIYIPSCSNTNRKILNMNNPDLTIHAYTY